MPSTPDRMPKWQLSRKVFARLLSPEACGIGKWPHSASDRRRSIWLMSARTRRNLAGVSSTSWDRNGAGRAGNLLVSELYADEGCWSGYPPHKHDTDQFGETAHQEAYHWRFNPPNGFGAQLWYSPDGDSTAYMTRDGDTFAFSDGYHPTVTSPFHESYIFTILVGETQRSLVQNFDATYRHLMDRIPGIAAMRDKFK